MADTPWWYNWVNPGSPGGPLAPQGSYPSVSTTGGDSGLTSSDFYGANPADLPAPSSSGAVYAPAAPNTPNTNTGGANAFGAANLVGAGVGLYQAIEAGKALNQLNSQPFPTPSIAPELQTAYNKAEDMSKGGYTAKEKAAFQQDLSRGSATNSYYGMKNAGAGLGASLQAGLNAQNLDAYDKFAAKDAELHRQNLATAADLAGQLQSQKNLIDAAAEKRRYLQEQAYGGALNAGLSNIMKSFNLGGLANTALSVGETAAVL